MADSHLKFTLELPSRTFTAHTYQKMNETWSRRPTGFHCASSECAYVRTTHDAMICEQWTCIQYKRPGKKTADRQRSSAVCTDVRCARARARTKLIPNPTDTAISTIRNHSDPFSMHANNKSVILPSNKCSINGERAYAPRFTFSARRRRDMWHRERERERGARN